MENKHKISQYRERLDKTLASHDLTNEETLKILVKNQLLHSSQYETEEDIDSVLEKRTTDVSNFLDMLRSASVNENEISKTRETPHVEWKLKQDTEDCRIMYREGPQGTPFHTLLAEGYVDAPIDVCLCVSWDTSLYKNWWPQFSVPTFKVISCQCLQKVRISEQISLVRIKVSWPLSAREALLHYFEFEYLQDGLIVVLINTISNLESINKSTHGFTNDGIPEENDMVRIDLVGGFALQKVTSDRSYFRTIGNMDMKLDFAPPSLINFISRRVIGNGFRLYQKAVSSVSKGDENFGKALGDPLYSRIREALYSNIKEDEEEPEDLESDSCIVLDEHVVKPIQDDTRDMDPIFLGNESMTETSQENASEDIKSDSCITSEEHMIKTIQDDQIVLGNESATESLLDNAPVNDQCALGEIEEEEIEARRQLPEGSKGMSLCITNQIAGKFDANNKKNVSLNPEVEQALGTLERVISMVRKFGFNSQFRFPSDFVKEEFPNLESDAENNSTSSKDLVDVEVSKEETPEGTSDAPRNNSGIQHSRHMGSSSYLREANNRIVPASPEENLPTPIETLQASLFSSKNGIAGAPTLQTTTSGIGKVSSEVDSIHENSLKERKELSQKKKHRYCCLLSSHF